MVGANDFLSVTRAASRIKLLGLAMNSKIAFDERIHFSDRLKAALVAANQPTGASAFARAYNLRADGATVTTHGVRKWLKGEAIPTHEKILIIAKWLHVHSSWLRFGDAENSAYDLPASMDDDLSTEHLALIHDIAALPLPAQTIIRDIVDSFMRVSASEQGVKAAGMPNRRRQPR